MKDIVDYIDSYYKTIYPDYKFWGLAELTWKSNDRFPVTVQSRDKVCLDQRYDCVVWHRLVSSVEITENEDFNWGLDEPNQYGVTLKTIVAYKVELGEGFMFDFVNNWPEDIIISSYQYLEASNQSIDVDHEAIVITEEIHTQYEKHRMCWNIFSFDTSIDFIICEETSP